MEKEHKKNNCRSGESEENKIKTEKEEKVAEGRIEINLSQTTKGKQDDQSKYSYKNRTNKQNSVYRRFLKNLQIPYRFRF